MVYSSHGPATPGSCNHLTSPFAPAAPYRHGDCVWIEWLGWVSAPGVDLARWSGQYDGLYGETFRPKAFKARKTYKMGYREGQRARTTWEAGGRQGYLGMGQADARADARADQIGREMASPCEPDCALCFEGVCLRSSRVRNDCLPSAPLDCTDVFYGQPPPQRSEDLHSNPHVDPSRVGLGPGLGAVLAGGRVPGVSRSQRRAIRRRMR